MSKGKLHSKRLQLRCMLLSALVVRLLGRRTQGGKPSSQLPTIKPDSHAL